MHAVFLVLDDVSTINSIHVNPAVTIHLLFAIILPLFNSLRRGIDVCSAFYFQ